MRVKKVHKNWKALHILHLIAPHAYFLLPCSPQVLQGHCPLVWLGLGFSTALTAQWIRFIILVQSSKRRKRDQEVKCSGGKVEIHWSLPLPTSIGSQNKISKRVAAYLAFTNVLFLMEDPQIILLGSVNQIFQFPPLTQYGRSRKSFLTFKGIFQSASFHLPNFENPFY